MPKTFRIVSVTISKNDFFLFWTEQSSCTNHPWLFKFLGDILFYKYLIWQLGYSITILWYFKMFIFRIQSLFIVFFKVEFGIFLPKLSVWSPAINQKATLASVLTYSTFGIHIRYISEMQTKQEPVDSLIFLMTQCSLQLCLFPFCNQTRFIYHYKYIYLLMSYT